MALTWHLLVCKEREGGGKGSGGISDPVSYRELIYCYCHHLVHIP